MYKSYPMVKQWRLITINNYAGTRGILRFAHQSLTQKGY